ncbi:DUF262 domain-containing HNH endonuclease family protein [Mycolicibacterium sp.]|uniref:DUF262 domain-containing protein n=1 Tax=Mycolicibacterium sp. TaxID=2320850 RepID=UPI001A2D604E|nr:DUF262 domain-containing HNH endonuclease family protein [Mycolicibacterium sp.]MBJ7339771.1 DUF262 domain-containing protein [Mycolicibacterium sp.]
MSIIQTHSLTVTQAFQSCFYRVPEYQREYVWTADEAIQLLDDINESIGDDGKQYFVGTVLVAPDDSNEQTDELDLIDGQQRTTTFYLILCALRRRFLRRAQQPAIEALLATSYTDFEGNTISRLRLEPCYENATELVDFLRQFNGEDAELSDALAVAGLARFGSSRRIADVFVAVSAYLQRNFSSDADLGRFWGHFANKVIFIQIQTDVSSALKIFETINERGIGLNPMDLLKNLLFSKVSPKEFGKLKDKWSGVTTPLERDKQKPLRFLRYFIMANYEVRDPKGKHILREDDIYSWFTEKRNAEATGYVSDPFRFVDELRTNVDRYIAFLRNRDPHDNPSVALANLRHLTGTAFSQHHVLLLAAAPCRPAVFEHLVAEIENFLFYYLFTSSNTRELESLFSSWSAELRAIARVPDETAQRTALNDFVEMRFQSSMTARHDELRDALRRFRLGGIQQYRSRYLLARIAQYVDMAFAGVKTRGSLDPYTKLEIEHILPRSPSDDLRESWMNDGVHEYATYVNRLGNLALLEKPHNIVASNSFFDAKTELYSKSGNYMTRSISGLSEVGKNTSVTEINRYLGQYDVWDAAAIDRRTDLLIDLALHIWKTRPLD